MSDDDNDRMLDDSEVRFSMIEIHAKPSSTPEPISLTKERELRTLRARVGLLEEENVRLRGNIAPAMSTIESHEEKVHRSSTCGFHTQVLVSMETSSVSCAVCDAELSPLDVLREFARDERRFVSSVNSLREEKDRLANECEQLKKQTSALRAKTRKAAGYDATEYKSEVERYSARAYYDLLAELAAVRCELKELKSA